MADKLKTLINLPGGGQADLGMRTEYNSWDMVYHAGVAYRITSVSKYVQNRKTWQELTVKREN